MPPAPPAPVPTRFALAGRVATLDETFKVQERSVVYLDSGRIAAIRPLRAAPPEGFSRTDIVDTGGTLYPGLIELHNHLSYNALPLWEVPRRFSNRSQWNKGDHYRKYITGPMKVLANSVESVLAIVRYVECKCLLGGTTTSQGIRLSSYQGIERYYRGVIRNVEKTYDASLPNAATHIDDVEAEDRDAFLDKLRRLKCQLLHLAEGRDEAARATFLSLQAPSGEWAITGALAGIHAAALTRPDFDVLARHGASMVWSPLSNLLLYGETAPIEDARAAGVRIALGSDWSPSGSKNLLGELKVARLVSEERGGVFSARELAAAATREAAKILSWERELGTIAEGKRADLLVVEGKRRDPYVQLLEALEPDINLVVIDGVPRYGRPRLMNRLLGTAALDAEQVTIRRSRRLLFLRQENADPDVGALRLADARSRLEDAMGRLPELARELQARPALSVLDPEVSDQIGPFLVLDHEEVPGFDLRPHFDDPAGARAARREELLARAATPLPDLLEAMSPDPLSSVGDRQFLPSLKRNVNLPEFVKSGLERAL
jgi:5-methylthioadenosine/S-adenosylhomocysteine deaminase